jgi:hypothetical protein
MTNYNDILPNLVKKFPAIISKKTVEQLVLSDTNALSFECASVCIDELESADTGAAKRSQESTLIDGKSAPSDYDTKNEHDFTLEEIKRLNFANVKFKALVDYARKEDTLLYTEFNEIDSARNRIASDIISKYENDFNSFLVSLRMAEGVDKSVIDSLIQTKIHVGELN